ncbi:galactokinase [Frankia sp. Cr1]|uniref:galactokinase n=1 Tax=Frankia sp. Cr1 TaxID=3073931 RepID=UPI002AD57647|nr:galactokinase [Frankia sp. Cr1]
MTGFDDVFGRSPEAVWQAPGRVNIIGEHTDYNEGFVLPIAVPLCIRASVAHRPDNVLRLASAQMPGPPVHTDLSALRPGALRDWPAYPAGVVWALRERTLPVAGVDLHITGDVPAGAGMSSSAAVACAVAAALNDLWDLGLSRTELVAVAQQAESDFVGMPCGSLDQSASLLAEEGHALFLDTRTLAARHIPFDLPAHGLSLLVADTKAPHRLVDGAYARRRASCEQAARTLGVRALRDLTVADLGTALGQLDAVTARRTRHVVTENARVLDAAALLETGTDPRRLGPLLTASHWSLRDDYEVTVPELDTAVDAALAAGAHGARMFGAGFGGSVLALVDAADRNRTATAIVAAATAAGHPRPTTFEVAAAPGARRMSIHPVR